MADQAPLSSDQAPQPTDAEPQKDQPNSAEQPVVEISYPVAGPPAPEILPKPVKLGHGRRLFRVVQAAVAVMLLLATSVGSYAIGYQRGHSLKASNTSRVAATSLLQVPKGATIIEQCAVGRGTQYVLPSNIPHGPVFNVYHGKVVGIEYMIGKDDLANKKTFYDLPLYGQKYDHIDVGLLSQGHTGYPVPHYHVDVYSISRAASAAITCK